MLVTRRTTPMQEGMLVHYLQTPGSGTDIEQIVCRAGAAVCPDRLHNAFEKVCERHEGLRARFEWQNRPHSVQIFERSASPEMHMLDWSSHSPEAFEEKLAAFLVEDRGHDFDLRRCPLMRLTFVRGPADMDCWVWSFHHIILDGRSFALVLSEVLEVYEASATGRAPVLSEPVPFSRFLDWDESADRGDGRAYYRSLLADVEEPTQVNVNLTTRVPQTGERRFDLRLSADDSEAIVSAAKSFGVTPNTLFAGAWALVVARYTGTSDVVFGSTRACRNPAIADVNRIVGMLINTVVTRVRVSSEDTVGSWLASLREQQVAQRSVERVRLADAQQHAPLPAGTPLFDSVVVLDDATLDRRLGGRGQFEYHGQTNYHLTLAGYLDPEISVRLEVDPARFDPATARRMLGHFARLFTALGRARPHDRVVDLPMLGAEERRALLYESNETARPFPELGLTDRFESAVDADASRVALVSADDRWTYADLEARANGIAHRLLEMGVRREEVVGICLPRSFDLVAALLAVPKAGAAYVPLDPAHPPARQDFMLQDSGAKIVITTAERAERLTDCQCLSLGDSDTERTISEHSRASGRPAVDRAVSDLAYIIYTSGSTGTPKGVRVRHRAVSNLIDWVNRTFAVGEADRLLFVTSVCFDLSVYDVFGVLGAGGSLYVATERELADPRRLIDLLAGGTITFWDSAPTALARLAPLLPERALASRLRLVFLSGDWVPVVLPDQIRSVFGELEFVALGGATEATVWSNAYSVGEVGPKWPSIPYGVPIQNARYYVLDRRWEPTPVGVVGDLFIGGDVLADGYHRRPELNADRFLPDPHVEGGRIYRTGDLARFLPDGNIEFMGRRDHQVKLRGFRVELGEIEAVLNRQPNVSTSVADAPIVDGLGRRLTAYVVPARGATVDVEAIRAAISSTLPEYMVPQHIVVLEKLPMTANGKLDRRQLPVPTAAPRTFVPTRTDAERAVAECFEHCLEQPEVGANADFFELGGQSIVAVRVVGRLASQHGLDVSLADLLTARTVEQIAARAKPVKGAAIVPAPADAERSLTFGQERMVFIQRIQPDSAAYNVPLALRIRGALDVDALSQAIDGLVDRHECLRTSIVAVDGENIPRVHPRRRVPLEVIALASDSIDELSPAFTRPFKLDDEPLARWRLGRVDDHLYILVVVVHHAVFDGESWTILLRELVSLYDAAVTDQTAKLPDLPLKYTDFASWQRNCADFKDDLAYWLALLPNPPPRIDIASDRPRPPVFSYRGAILPFRVDAELSERLELVAREHDATPFAVLSGAFALLVGRYAAETKILVGTPVSERGDPRLDGVIGFFVNTHALYVDLDAASSFGDLIKQVYRRVVELLDHRLLPFDQLVEALNPPRDNSRTPLVQVFFSYEETAEREVESNHLDLEPVLIERAWARTDLSLFMERTSTGLEGHFEYATDLFDCETIERMGRGLTAILEHIARSPTSALVDVPVMAPDVRATLVAEPEPFEYDPARTIDQQVLAIADAHPDRVAISFGDEVITYDALRDQVRRFAGGLHARGVQPGDRVALMMPRTPSFVAAALATMNLGAAYVPLDPTYPAIRNQRIIDVVEPAIVVTDDRLRGAPRTQPSAAKPDALVYVIFTSGSTGEPKGVEITHRALVNFIASMSNYPGIDAEDRVLALTTFAFDIATLELYLPLTVGACIDLADSSQPESVVARMATRPPTVLQGTPSTMRMLLSAGWSGDDGLTVLCGGEPMSPTLARDLSARCRRVFNMYGPTETTVWSSVDEVKAEGPITVGTPIANTKMYVLDGAMRLAPPGVKGELFIGGHGVARGYHRRPELTDERFLADPFSATGARIYRTGDIARRRTDGRFELFGRSDLQVKVRGYRVELGEIEAALESHPAVEKAVVNLTGAATEARLDAFVVGQGDDISPRAVREHVKAQLPPSMVPAAVYAIAEVPLTPSGKIDRSALRPATDDLGPPPDRARPRDDLEVALSSIWTDLLGRPIGVTDSFFDHGGHSLLALRLIAEANTEFKVRLSLASFLENPTISQMAAEIRQGGGRPRSSVIMLARGRKDAPPIYFACGFHLYQPVAQGIGHPGYGLVVEAEQRFLDGEEVAPPSVEGLARSYFEILQQHQPQGPLAVSGVSFGGLVAFELARQLAADGRQPLALVMIDSVLDEGLRLNGRKWFAQKLEQINRNPAQLLGGIGRLFGGEPKAETPVDPADALEARRQRWYREASRAYMNPSKTYAGRTLLIRASETYMTSHDPQWDLGWSSHLSSFDVVEVAGDHLGILAEPAVGDTASAIRRVLSEEPPSPPRASSQTARNGQTAEP